MNYDWDLIIVGGGPAGISAAVRARWVKRDRAVPCSVLLIENSSIGGLAAWQGCFFTGPSWKIEGKEILSRMKKDLLKLNIPVHYGRVTRITGRGDVKEVITSGGKVFRSLAVVITTGIKVLVNEIDYLGKGLMVTSMGYEFIVSRTKELLSRRWEPRLVIVGSAKLMNLIPLIRELNRAGAGSDIAFVMEEEGDDGEGRDGSGEIIRGWVESYWGDGGLKGISVLTPEGRRDMLCAGVLLDFNSYELLPTCRINMGDSWSGSTFIEVNRDMQTSVPGIFAAGDVTAGGYNSFSRAVSDGISAGLSAYRYIYYRKFGREPCLFAYRPTDFCLYKGFRELPALDDGLKPMALSGNKEIEEILGKAWGWLTEMLNGRMSINEIISEKGVSRGELTEMLKRLLLKKMITFHIEVRECFPPM